jgi:hypothetical protein
MDDSAFVQDECGSGRETRKHSEGKDESELGVMDRKGFPDTRRANQAPS